MCDSYLGCDQEYLFLGKISSLSPPSLRVPRCSPLKYLKPKIVYTRKRPKICAEPREHSLDLQKSLQIARGEAENHSHAAVRDAENQRSRPPLPGYLYSGCTAKLKGPDFRVSLRVRLSFFSFSPAHLGSKYISPVRVCVGASIARCALKHLRRRV